MDDMGSRTISTSFGFSSPVSSVKEEVLEL